MSLKFNIDSITPVSGGGGGGGSAKKFGADISCVFGGVDSDGIPIPSEDGEYSLVFTGVKKISMSNIWGYKFFNNKNIVSVSFPDYEQETGSIQSFCLTSMFENCINNRSVSFAKAVKFQNTSRMFANNTNLETVNMPLLQEIGNSAGSMFAGCSKLKTATMPNLTTISASYGMSYFFQGSAIETFTFEKLTTIAQSSVFNYLFANSSIKTLSFPALTSSSFGGQTNQFNNMLAGVTGCTVHFPSNLQNVIGDWSSVTGGFSGTNTVVLFDLEATE